jgi:DNA-binding transcriptional LysR family regulator
MRGTAYAQMECFVAVARHAGFASAARSLRLAPSTLSSAIVGLEQRLGVRLFNRTTRSVSRHEAGERLLARSRRSPSSATSPRGDCASACRPCPRS